MFIKVIAVLGKGGAGKSTIFGNLGIQLFKYLQERKALHGLFGIDFDAIPFFNYDLLDMGIEILNVSSDLDVITRNKNQIVETIREEKEKNNIIINFPGDNTLDLFMELVPEIDEVLIVTHQEKTAHNIVPQIILNIFKYLQRRADLAKSFNRIFTIYNRVGTKYAEDQFGFPGKRMVDKKLFSTFEDMLQELFIYNEIDMTVKIQGIHWFDNIHKEKNQTNDLTIVPLYHIPRDPFIYKSGIQHRPFILDYLANDDLEKLPLPVRAIKENALFFLNNIFNPKG